MGNIIKFKLYRTVANFSKKDKTYKSFTRKAFISLNNAVKEEYKLGNYPVDLIKLRDQLWQEIYCW